MTHQHYQRIAIVWCANVLLDTAPMNTSVTTSAPFLTIPERVSFEEFSHVNMKPNNTYKYKRNTQNMKQKIRFQKDKT
jgi:hypothetical protein